MSVLKKSLSSLKSQAPVVALRVGPFGKNDDNGDPTKLTSRGWDLQSTSQRGLGFCRRIL